MDRRAFLGTLAGSVLSAPLTARAQQPRSVWRLGFLAPGLSQDTSRSAVLMQTLQELGYVQNQSFLVEHRFAEGKIERLPAMAAETGSAQGRCALHRQHPGGQGSSECDDHHPHCLCRCLRSGRIRSGSESRAARRQHHRRLHSTTRSECEGTPTPQGDPAARPSRGSPLEPRESGINRILC
jgi:hypothetical protein